MKRILLIGKTGQLGAEIIKHSTFFDFEVISFDRNELDVNNRLQTEEKILEAKPDILINTSAYHIVSKCEDSPADALAINFIAVRNLAKVCRDNNIIFVTYSTDYVFDGNKNEPYQESDEPNPLQVYGLSKLSGEYAVLSSFAKGSFIIRTNGIYGGKTGSPEKNGNFVLNIIEESQSKATIKVSSEQIVSPTYAGDLSIATLRLLNSKAKFGVYHLVNEGFCSWYEFAKEVFKLAKIDKEIVPVDRKGLSGEMRRPKFSALKNTKAKALGIVLPSWQEGLKKYIDFLDIN